MRGPVEGPMLRDHATTPRLNPKPARSWDTMVCGGLQKPRVWGLGGLCLLEWVLGFGVDKV